MLLCDTALFGWYYFSKQCSKCKDKWSDDEEEDGECNCKYVRISMIPVVDKKDEFEERELFSIPEINGKIVGTHDIVYRIVVEKEKEKQEFGGKIGEIELEILFDMGAEDEYYREISTDFIKFYKKGKNYDYCYSTKVIKKSNTYKIAFIEKMESIINNNSKKVQQKENSHVGKVKKS
jgi:hypothetical protein